jgi:hypothetical protein
MIVLVITFQFVPLFFAPPPPQSCALSIHTYVVSNNHYDIQHGQQLCWVYIGQKVQIKVPRNRIERPAGVEV